MSAARTITPPSVQAQDELQFGKLADRHWVYLSCAPYYRQKYGQKYVTLQIGQNSHENEFLDLNENQNHSPTAHSPLSWVQLDPMPPKVKQSVEW